MTLIIYPTEIGTPPCSYPSACTGTQRYGNADWNDLNGAFDGCVYTINTNPSYLTPAGVWAVGYTPSVVRVTWTYTNQGGFDTHDFTFIDTYLTTIGTASVGSGVGTFFVDITLTFGGFDIGEFKIDSFGYGGLQIDSICFDPV